MGLKGFIAKVDKVAKEQRAKAEERAKRKLERDATKTARYRVKMGLERDRAEIKEKAETAKAKAQSAVAARRKADREARESSVLFQDLRTLLRPGAPPKKVNRRARAKTAKKRSSK